MIGQKRILDTLIKWRLNRAIPRFIIIEGEEGSGRLTIAKKVIEMLNATGVIIGNSKEDVKSTIDNAYNVQSTTVYIFRNADDMSISAKNSLLKVIEEPPNKAYFIMTLKSKSNTLETILSRGTLIRLDPYSLDELKEFNSDELVTKYCRTPGACKDTDSKQIMKVKSLAGDVINGLHNKSGVEVLKACTKLSSKADDGKIDSKLFFDVFSLDYMEKSGTVSMPILQLLANCGVDLAVGKVNKKNCVETTLMKILEVLKNETT